MAGCQWGYQEEQKKGSAAHLVSPGELGSRSEKSGRVEGKLLRNSGQNHDEGSKTLYCRGMEDDTEGLKQSLRRG